MRTLWGSNSWGQNLLRSELRNLQIGTFTKPSPYNFRRAPETHDEAVYGLKISAQVQKSPRGVVTESFLGQGTLLRQKYLFLLQKEL